VDRLIAVRISSFVYIDKTQYLGQYERSETRKRTQRTAGAVGENTMDLVSRLDLVDAIARDRQRELANASHRRAAQESRQAASPRTSLVDRLTVVFGASSLPTAPRAI
jgi:hypothetical protein